MKHFLAKSLMVGALLTTGHAYAAACTPTDGFFTPQSVTETGLSSLNAGFFGINNAYLGSPEGPAPDQLGGGGWLRESTGTFNTKSKVVTRVIGFCNPFLAQVKTKTDYTGVQTGFDIGRYNLSASGASVNFGVTGGFTGINSVSPDIAGDKEKQYFSVPFVGLYGAYKNGPFSIDLLVRHDFVEAKTSYPLLFTSPQVPNYITGTRGGESTTISSSAAYHIDVNNLFFIEPSIGVALSGISTLKLSSPGANGKTSVQLITAASSSNLGRATIRVGKDFVIGNYIVEPFVAASVWNEFGSKVRFYSLQCVDPTAPCPASSQTVFALAGEANRIGTWAQYSAGASVKFAGTPFSAFVRGDLRTGDKVSGDAFTGGVRYQF